MTAAWMLFALVVSALFGAAALAAERVATALGRPVRFVWLGALLAPALWPLAALAGVGPNAESSAIAGALVIPFTAGAHHPAALGAGPSTTGIAGRLDALLLAGWAALSAFLLLRLARALRTLGRRRAAWRAERVDGVPVRLAPDVGPAVVGLRPMEIVLPEWMLALDQPLRAMVLRHEDEHRRARDPYLLFASALLLALVPWNIPMWWYARRLRLAIEMDCDARVLRAHPRPERYGLLLLTIAQRHAGTSARLSPALSEPTSHLERRIIAMRRTLPRFTRVRALVFGCAAAAAIAIACSVPGPDRVAGPTTSPEARTTATTPDVTTYFSFQVDHQTQPVAGNPNPAYPASLENARVSGEVVVQFVVDADGQVDMATFKVLKTTDSLFVDAVQRVLPKWHFTPARSGEHAVKQLVQMPFTFKVD